MMVVILTLSAMSVARAQEAKLDTATVTRIFDGNLKDDTSPESTENAGINGVPGLSKRKRIIGNDRISIFKPDVWIEVLLEGRTDGFAVLTEVADYRVNELDGNSFFGTQRGAMTLKLNAGTAGGWFGGVLISVFGTELLLKGSGADGLSQMYVKQGCVAITAPEMRVFPNRNQPPAFRAREPQSGEQRVSKSAEKELASRTNCDDLASSNLDSLTKNGVTVYRGKDLAWEWDRSGVRVIEEADQKALKDMFKFMTRSVWGPPWYLNRVYYVPAGLALVAAVLCALECGSDSPTNSLGTVNISVSR